MMRVPARQNVSLSIRVAQIAVAATVALAGAQAHAQERGSTQGPEGSEIGKGGYRSAFTPKFSLQFDWGAAFTHGGPTVADKGPPLFIGGTAGLWFDEWIVLEASGHYVMDSRRTNILIGPRFRLGYRPIALSAGLKAGPMLVKDEGPRFGLSPQVGAEFLVVDRLLMGLSYAADIAFGAGTAQRIGMNLGWRF